MKALSTLSYLGYKLVYTNKLVLTETSSQLIFIAFAFCLIDNEFVRVCPFIIASFISQLEQ
jgi:hypothetical protein